MSKRSYRRVAVVAGAALAIGSMAPAMATRGGGGDADADADVKVAGTASVSVDTIDVGDLMADIQSIHLSLPTGLVFETLDDVKATVGYHAPILVGDVREIARDLRCPVVAALDLDVAAAALATAGVNVGNGNIGVGAGAHGLVGAPLGVVEDLHDCIGEIKADVVETLDDTKAAVKSTAVLATGTARGIVRTATAAPGTLVGVAGPLVFGTVSNLNVTATAQLAAVVSVL